MKEVIRFLATFGYLGQSPKAPGTVGTIGALPLVWLMYLMGPFAYMGIALVLTLVAIFICMAYENQHEGHDRSEIVIDEVVGFVITMTWLPLTWQALVLGFALFRLLDILKPFPIGLLDKKVKGGVGVVVDDVAAGVIANILLQVIYTQTNWLGVQIITP